MRGDHQGQSDYYYYYYSVLFRACGLRSSNLIAEQCAGSSELFPRNEVSVILRGLLFFPR